MTKDQVTVAVCVFAFDLLYLNGESWVTKPFRERRQGMYDLLPVEPGHFCFASHLDSSDSTEVMAFLFEAIEASCEGLMVSEAEDQGGELVVWARLWPLSFERGEGMSTRCGQVLESCG